MNLRRAACLVAALLIACGGILLLTPRASGAAADERRVSPQALADFMQRDLNSALTATSYEIFHRRQLGRPVEMTPQLSQALDGLQNAAARLGELRTVESDEAPFRMYVINLQSTVHALANAVATSQTDDEIHHWFNHVSAACESCHSEYKR